HRRDGPGHPARRGHRDRGHRRHRAGPRPAARRHGGGQVRGHRQQGLAGRARRAGARGVPGVRHRSLLRGGGGGGPPHPPAPRPARESLAGDPVHRVLGIVNGTTNFILDRMDGSGADFGDSLEEAQSLGYAEADPTADVEAFDAAAKAAILAGLAFHTRVTAADVYREGITEVTAADIASAKSLGRTVKLLAICERSGASGSEEEGVAVRVHPAMIPRSHPLAAVGGAYNAVFVEARSAGRLMFYGAGAGGAPTPSPGLGGVVAGGANPLRGTQGPRASTHAGLAGRPR